MGLVKVCVAGVGGVSWAETAPPPAPPPPAGEGIRWLVKGKAT